jgi:hypothetical protein
MGIIIPSTQDELEQQRLYKEDTRWDGMTWEDQYRDYLESQRGILAYILSTGRPLTELDRSELVCLLSITEPSFSKPLIQNHKPKSKSAIQFAVEAYCNETGLPDKNGFYSFLKIKIKFPKELILKNGQSYAYFFDKIVVSGVQEGVYLNHPKEGKKEGEPRWNHYSSADVCSIINKEKRRRKIISP